MLLIYASRTNNIQRFINRLQKIEKIIHLQSDNLIVNEPFCLITYTDKIGAVPEIVEKFLVKNHQWLKAVVSSGNRNFGNFFARSGDLIAQKYQVPLLMKFELSGTEADVEKFETLFKSLSNQVSKIKQATNQKMRSIEFLFHS
ncbi:Ribonucleoside-diphosphate reductase class Ib, assembly flavoprotein NrdI [[Mycoplasma] cavipharyngis]|uniref:class Ib ribonucleoside-diphosphate reductase assembly flavoprotein NrdI n=1 Tax=[Mycoplasma] cavipharyngis TaxID=92757 RepID=UPI003704812B